MANLHISRISLADFRTVLSRYETEVPEKLKELDAQRYEVIPGTVATRKSDKEGAWLERDEVEKLVEWKLKHGTFRPTLLSLVRTNTPSTTTTTTRTAFSDPSLPNPLKPLKTLTSLKGIGPATGSLLLSVHSPDSIPFFSDEMFLWCMWDEEARGSKGKGTGRGWEREIKYSVKEYVALVERVGALRRRLGEGNVKAVDVERVAWVLGRDGIDLDGEDESGGVRDGGEKGDVEPGGESAVMHDGDMGKGKRKADDEAKEKKSVKRKAVEKPPTKGLRRSGRTKSGT